MTVLYRDKIQDNLKITTVRDLEGVENVRSVWEQMQRGEKCPAPHADINRYLALVHAIGDLAQPYIVLLTNHSHPVAMAICRIEQRKLKLRLGYKTLFRPTLRCISVSYGGILGQPSHRSCEIIIGELTKALQRGEVDMVFLEHLRTDSAMYEVCKKASGFWMSNYMSTDLHWQTEIPRTIEELYDSVPNSRRRRWHRDLRQMERAAASDIKVICYRDVQDVGHLANIACQIEEKTYKKGLEIGFASSPLNRALLEQAARNGWMRAYVLYVGDEPCAYQFDVRYEGTQFTEYGSFDPRWSHGSPGIVLLLKVLEQLCMEEGVTSIDYGFGDAIYKRKFGTRCWSEESVCIYAARLRPMLIKIIMSANLTFSLLGRGAMLLGIDRWLKRSWRKAILRGENRN